MTAVRKAAKKDEMTAVAMDAPMAACSVGMSVEMKVDYSAATRVDYSAVAMAAKTAGRMVASKAACSAGT